MPHPAVLIRWPVTVVSTLALCILLASSAPRPGHAAARAELLTVPRVIDVRDGDARIGLSPVRFEPQRATPGTELRYELTVTNTTNDVVRLTPTTLALAGSSDPGAYASPTPKGRSAAAVSWVSYPGFGASRELQPGSGLRMPVAVVVPPDTAPGTYALGLGVTKTVSAPGISTEASTRVRLALVLASPAVIRVPGDAVATVGIRDIDAPRVVWGSEPTFRVRVENTGDTDLVIDGKIDLSSFLSSAGRTLDASGPEDGYPTLPGGIRELKMRWSNPPLLGWYQPELVVVGGKGSGVRVTDNLATVFVLPPWWLILLLIVALLLPLRAWRRRRRDPLRGELERTRARERVEARMRRDEAKRRAEAARRGK